MRLWLHHELLQIVAALGNKQESKADFNAPEGKLDPLIFAKMFMSYATVFDCRRLPIAFVLDTGNAVAADAPEARGPVQMPFGNCYFEFADKTAVWTSVPETIVDDETDAPIEVFAKPVYAVVFKGARPADQFISSVQFMNEAGKPLYSPTNDDTVLYPEADEGARLLLGVLALMKERLIISEFAPDPRPFVSKARKKKGKLPISSPSHVLTVNVPAVRRAVQASAPGKTHESPCLHWRRGHWRVLHRYSEFEGRTWVHRCLVGDPDKGFVRTQYRLISDLPMLEPKEPTLESAS